MRTHSWFSPSSINRMLRELKISRKKMKLPAEERFTPYAFGRRMEYLAEISEAPLSSLYFVDETYVDHSVLKRHYGHANVGHYARVIQRYVRTDRFTVLSCIGWNGLVAYRIIKGTTKTDDFNDFIMKLVAKNIPASSLIIADNAACHYDPGLSALLDLEEKRLVFLPPYSPDLNPIELSYSYFKKVLQVNIRFIF